jgi:polyisoprenoid-binding protein YceI
MMRNGLEGWAAVALLPIVLTGTVHAQNAPAPPAGFAPPPPGAMAPASKDPNAAPAGNYKIDLEHSSVVARVSHRGMSFNVLRFGVRQADLRWNPAKPSTIGLDVTIDAKPFYAPIVYTIPPEGPQSLNAAKFPDARFVSTAVRQTGDGKAVIEGQLTLMGVTKPAVINAELVGVGRSMEGAPTVGFTGTMIVNWSDFTQLPIARMIGKITVILDAEFQKI